jgi:transcriptional regulator with XRE-family HTH domain
MVKPNTRRENSGMGLSLPRRIGLRIKAARRGRSMTQEQLAEHVGLTVESISNIERGKTSAKLTTLEAISRKLGVPLSDLVGEDRGGSPRRIDTEARGVDLLRRLKDADLEVAVRQIEALASRAKPGS